VKQRILTGILLVAAVLGALALPSRFFAPLAAGLTLLLVYEWVRLCRTSRRAKLIFALMLPLAMSLCLVWPQLGEALYRPVVIGNILMWSVIVILLITSPMVLGHSLWGKYGPELGALLLFGFWLTLTQLHSQHIWLLMTTLAGVTLFDTFALVWGIQFGKRKLSPKLSPGKTWEGVAGGTLAALTPIAILALADSKNWINSHAWYIPAVALSIAIAPFGDLFESLLKRLQGVKDSGVLLPGHGGLLDRVDSHLAVVPFCAFFALVFA